MNTPPLSSGEKTGPLAAADLPANAAHDRWAIDASPITTIYLNNHGIITFENPATRELLGKLTGQAVSVVGQPISQVCAHLTTDASEMIGQLLNGRRVTNHAVYRQPITGQNFYLELLGVPLLNAAGSQTGAIFYCNNVTHHRQTERTQQAIYNISKAVHTANNLQDLFRQIHTIIVTLLPAENLYVALYDNETGEITFPYVIDDDPTPLPKFPGKGLTAYVLRTGQPLLATGEIFDSLLAAGEIEQIGRRPVDWLGVPLKIGDKTIGVLAVQSYVETMRIKPDDQDILVFVSTQVAMAIEHKQSEEELRRRNRELSLFNRIIEASVANQPPEYILEITCRELATIFNISQVAALLLNPQKTIATMVAEYTPEEALPGFNWMLSVAVDPLIHHLLTHKTPMIVNNAPTDPRAAGIRRVPGWQQVAAVVLLPLLFKDEIIGGLVLGHTQPRRFLPQEISLAWSAADQVAGAINRVHLTQTYYRLATAIEQAAESVIITDTQGIILYVNPACERVSGYSQAELLGRNPKILQSGKHSREFYDDLWRTITSGETWHGRFINKKKDGRLYTEDTSITPIRAENGETISFVSVQHDISREVDLENQYQQAQKMEAIGQLTAGIAHDFNNLLTVINGFVELAQNQVAEGDPLREMLDKVANSGHRAANLVRQLLVFSRKQSVEPKVLNLNDIAADLSKMLQRVIGEDIQMNLALTPNLWPIKADHAQIEQVIVNLVVNARDAMPHGGTLTIETGNITLDRHYAANHMGVKAGEYVQLSVSDTGCGIPEEIKDHIFEPFFTTKPQGKGTGLGLATVFGIIKQSNGYIWVYSEPNHGATFKVYLPRADAVAPPVKFIRAVNTMPMGEETILLVEDEASVRELTTELLLQQGYTVLVATNGAEAIKVFQSFNAPIHLLITDVIMPQMGGKELADRLVSLNPQLKVLFISGYTDETISRRGLLTEGIKFVQKPFSLTTIIHKVREVLDS